VIEAASSILHTAVAAADTFHALAAAHNEFLSTVTAHAFLDQPAILAKLEEVLLASHQFARRLARAVASDARYAHSVVAQGGGPGCSPRGQPPRVPATFAAAPAS